MGALSIPAAYDSESVLIADDEPEHLEWLIDYLRAKGKRVFIATNVNDALKTCEGQWFRVYIVDLNIPLGGWPEPVKTIYRNYPGLSIIEAVRSQGSDGRRVIAYSAHLNESINSEMRRLYTDYIAKGRPIQLKERLQELWALPDQTEATLGRLREFNARKESAVAKRRAAARTAKALSPAKRSVKPVPTTKKVTAPKQKRTTGSRGKQVQKVGSISQKRRGGRESK